MSTGSLLCTLRLRLRLVLFSVTVLLEMHTKRTYSYSGFTTDVVTVVSFQFSPRNSLVLT